jgi:hypothetical protein
VTLRTGLDIEPQATKVPNPKSEAARLTGIVHWRTRDKRVTDLVQGPIRKHVVGGML